MKVLLVYAGVKAVLPRFPLSVMVLASYLRKHGHDPHIIDLRIQNYEDLDFSSYSCIGISALTGPPLRAGLQFANFVKAQRPEMALIWGGPHVSFFPESSLRNPYVDIVVKGEGEETLLEVVEAIQDKKPLRGIKGVAFKKDGRVFGNDDRDNFMDLNELDLPAYDLVQVKKYGDSIEDFSYETSRGCPHRCGFCYVLNFHRRRWRAKSVDKVLDDLGEIVKIYNPTKIKFVEDNFFVDKKRVLEICHGIIERRFTLKWQTTIRADDLSRYSEEEMLLLKRSGCWCLIIGGESGSPRILKYIDKDIKKEQVLLGVEKSVKVGILPQISFMIGLPSESKKELYETLSFYETILGIGENVEINGLFIFTPYPGTPLYNEAVRLGYKPGSSLEEWEECNFNDIRNVPWFSKHYRNILRTISVISRFNFFVHRLEIFSKEYKYGKLHSARNIMMYKLFSPLLKLSARFRWKFRFFILGYEWRLFDFMRGREFEYK